MSGLVRISNGGVANSFYAGPSVNAADIDWQGIHPDTWLRLSDMPAIVRQQFTSNGYFPKEVHAFWISEPYPAELGGVPGFVAVTGWIMGDTHLLVFDVFKPESGDENTWEVDGTVTKFLSSAQAKEFASTPSTLDELLSEGSTGSATESIEKFGEGFMALPSDVRKRVLSLTNPTIQYDQIYKNSETRSPGSMGEETLELSLLTANSEGAIAVAAKTSVIVEKGCEKTVLEDAFARATWTVRFIRGSFREKN